MPRQAGSCLSSQTLDFSVHAMRGWVYVISNKAMPGLLKVGFTLKDPALRARELGQTGVPHPFVVDYEVMVEHPRHVEQRIHSKLAHVRERKEWFRCTLPEAVGAIRALVGDGALLENMYEGLVPQIPALEPQTPGRRAHLPANDARSGRVARIRFSATFSGPCQHCQVPFVVTVTRHESGTVCPSCHRYNNLSAFVSRELPR